jgi:EmrB/QacA subfamily drug resistance transporter
MNQPFAVPLFLPRESSDYSQPNWRTASLGANRPWARVKELRDSVRRRRAGAATESAMAAVPVGLAGTDLTRSGAPAALPRPSRKVGGGPSGLDARPDPDGDASPDRTRSRAVWAVAITGMALFMASLDNLVVSTALPVIRVHLHAGLSGLEWTVNAYTLTFAVLLLSAAAMGERFGRRRIFVMGIALFTAASAAAALAPSIDILIAARALQGAGGAMIMPLSLTLLSAAVPPERRNAALGIWGAIGGTAVAIGPLVGGAVTTGWSWQYIFWLNVPVGVVLVPLAWWKLSESRGASTRLDLAGVAMVSAGLFGVVLGLVQGNSDGWTSHTVLGSFAVGVVALAAFVRWELRSTHPMLDIRLFRHRGFTAVNVTAMLFSFGMFGAIFFLVQFLQVVQGLSPLAAGVRILPWTAMPMLLAPVVGKLAERWGGKPLVVTGLGLQAVGLTWLASLTTTTTPYGDLVAPFVVCGIGMTLFFVPLASLVLGAVPRSLEGVASGANAAFRELGGVLGIAVLGAVFSTHGGYRSGQDYVNGMTAAVYVGGAVVALGAVAALLVPGLRRQRADAAASAASGSGESPDVEVSSDAVPGTVGAPDHDGSMCEVGAARS